MLKMNFFMKYELIFFLSCLLFLNEALLCVISRRRRIPTAHSGAGRKAKVMNSSRTNWAVVVGAPRDSLKHSSSFLAPFWEADALSMLFIFCKKKKSV